MKKNLKMLGMLCGAGIFVGCASTQPGMGMKIVPAMKVSHSQESAEGYYSLGRYHHGARRLDEAMKAYERAVELEPRHTKARNALGILYAERGRYVYAIALLREATKIDPTNSYLHSNLGYACYLNGDYVDAAASLEQATRLDPHNVRARNNLVSVMEKLGRRDRSTMTFEHTESIKNGLRVASISTGNEVQQKTTVRNGNDISSLFAKSAIGQGNDRIGANPQPGSRTELKQVGSSLYEVHQIAVGREESKASVSTKLPASALHPLPAAKPNRTLPSASFCNRGTETNMPSSNPLIRLEISNGNGVNGMAKSLAKIIGGGTLRLARLTNHEQFNVKITRVEFREGYETLARSLADKLGRSIDIKQQVGTSNSDIRVVLGQDLLDLESLRIRFTEQMKIVKMNDEF